MQSVKREFFALRNGVIADVMRRAGSPFRIIFGLNLPQLVEIAGRIGEDAELSQLLWENRSTRCSMLLAPMIMPREGLTMGRAAELVEESPSVEVVDVLCHRLLRHLDFAENLVEELMESAQDMNRYAGLRLAFNLLNMGKMSAGSLRPQVEALLGDGWAPTAQLAAQLLEEIEFLEEEGD